MFKGGLELLGIFQGGPDPMSPLPTLVSPKTVIFGTMVFLALFVFLYVMFSCVLSLSHIFLVSVVVLGFIDS